MRNLPNIDKPIQLCKGKRLKVDTTLHFIDKSKQNSYQSFVVNVPFERAKCFQSHGWPCVTETRNLINYGTITGLEGS